MRFTMPPHREPGSLPQIDERSTATRTPLSTIGERRKPRKRATPKVSPFGSPDSNHFAEVV